MFEVEELETELTNSGTIEGGLSNDSAMSVIPDNETIEGGISSDGSVSAELKTETIESVISNNGSVTAEVSTGAGAGGTSDYEKLQNKPQINNIELVKNKTLDELGIQEKGDYPNEVLTNTEIEDLINNFVG